MLNVPDVKPIAPVTGLNVEPGHHVCKYLAIIGLSAFSFISFHSSVDNPVINLFGLYDGVLTNASSSPVLGCITTNSPLLSFNSLYNFVCNSESIVNFIFSPFCTSILAISAFFLPVSSSI